MNQQAGKTLLLALAGGAVFQLLHIPLGWLLGPMTALLIWREALSRHAVWPKGFRDGGLTLLGYMMGITFTAEIATQIAKQLPSMAAATLVTVLFGMAAGWLTVKRTGISMASGLSIIVAYQMFRLLFILFIAPYIVKGLLRVYHAQSDSPVKGF